MVVVGGHKTTIFTANISIFHMRYREYMTISDEFYEFCSIIISGISDDEITSSWGKNCDTLVSL
jgi:hypothetical protein